jgi:hypothetical protein
MSWPPAPTSGWLLASNPPAELPASGSRIACERSVTVNADLTVEDRFYEWLLSDHPGAVLERARRRLDNQVREAEERAMLRRFIARTDQSPDAPTTVRQLAGTAGWLVERSEQRLTTKAASTDAELVATARHDLETSRRVQLDDDYRYPARYLGTQAARQPIPPEPGARLHDPEERPALGDRTVKELDAENSPFAFVRTQTITGRAQATLQRTHRPQPAHQAHDGRQHARTDRARGDRQEAQRER